jgi:CheY-like chemotaxis protein
MSLSYAPGYYYPTKAIIIDDKKPFLESLDFISIEGIEIEPILGPSNFIRSDIDYLDKSENLSVNIAEDGEISTTWRAGGFPRLPRKKQASVVVCDYEMPEMCGIELLRSISNKHVQKILITGSDNEGIVIKAFNDKVIDAFIRKADPGFHDRLIELIKKSAYASFRSITYHEMIVLNKLYPEAVLFKKGAEEFLGDLLKKYGSSEFYLTDPNAEILFLDKAGVERRLMITNDATVDKYKMTAIDNGIADRIINAFDDKTRIPFFSKNDDRSLSFDQWDKSFHSYETVMFENMKYYYTVI